MYMCIPQSKIPLDQVFLFIIIIIIIIIFIFCMNVDVQSPELTGMYILTCSHEFLTKSMNRP